MLLLLLQPALPLAQAVLRQRLLLLVLLPVVDAPAGQKLVVALPLVLWVGGGGEGSRVHTWDGLVAGADGGGAGKEG